MQAWLTYAAGVGAFLVIGCAAAPPPRAVYQDQQTVLAIQQDSKAGSGHNHPAQLSLEVIRQVLDGIRIQSRKAFLVPSLITGGPQLAPAFSKEEESVLASHLSRALAEAKTDELVTFYRRVSTPTIGLAITSGGLFVHDKYLYVILANARTLPSESMREGLTYEIDPVDNPLLPISRTSFRATFEPATSMVPEDERWVWPYIDQGRVIVIDLIQLARDLRNPVPNSAP